jgi:acetyltransferase EpsM
VNLNPGVHINGATVVGEGAYVGTGAVTIQNVRVGRWSVIGAGAVVIDDIPDYSLAVGVPARVKKSANNPSE